MSNTPSPPTPSGYSDEALDRLNDELRHAAGRAGGLAAALPEVGPATSVGPYEIVELIGEGGMGSVYKAEQRRPVRRIVALKVVKPGLDTREVLARFEGERQALARMDHPNIAKVLDAGADNLGRPYFVMEFVPGVPITKFCDEQHLSVSDRLQLFTQVCDAITHAHTKAILHRDLKASNVLAYVDEAGKRVAKVIDFGVAKALTGNRLTEITFSTDRGVIVGTYDSMSPEQADGSRDIDTRSDVYSLGVLLYELLAGFKPIDREALTRANDYELRKIIREVEPPRPSTRLASLSADAKTRIAAAREMKPDALVRSLRNELEWIPLMAIRKERDRRYASPSALTDDVRNYLAGRPLVAGPESRAYVMKKFIARHRSTLGGVTVGAILLVVATTFYLHRIRTEQARTLEALLRAQEQTELAERQKRRAESENAIAMNVKDFVAEMLRALNPARARGREVRLEDVLRESATRIDVQFKDQPDVEAQLRLEIGQTMFAIGHADEALPHFHRACDLQEKLNGADAKPTMLARCRVGESLVDLGRYGEAETLYRGMLGRCLNLFAPHDPTRLTVEHRLGHLLSITGPWDESERLLRVVYDARRQLSGADNGPDGLDTLRVQSNLGLVLSRRGLRDEATELLSDALRRRLKKSDVADDPETCKLQQNLASHLFRIGRKSESVQYLSAALATARRIFPEGHPDLVSIMSSYVVLLQNDRKSSEAGALANEAYASGKRVLGPDHPATITAELMVQRVLAESGRAEEALVLTRYAMERRRRLYGTDHAETHDAMRALASTLRRADRADELVAVLQEMVASARRMYGPDSRDTMIAMAHAAGYLKDAKRFAEAEATFAEILRVAANHPEYMTPKEKAHYRTARAVAIKDQGRFNDAKPILESCLLELREVGIPPNDKSIRNCVLALADIAASEGDATKAAALRAEWERAAPAASSTRPATRPATSPVAAVAPKD